MQNPGFPGLATVFKEHKETFMDIQRVTLLTPGDSAIPRLADTSWYCGEVQLKKIIPDHLRLGKNLPDT
jgi:hypothetical protein